MSNYLPSNKVKIYPSGFRGTDNNTNLLDPESRLVSEKNLTSGIKALTNKSIRTDNSKNSFVISNDPISSSNFEICIYGYIFKLDLTDFITNGAGKDWINIWAKIKLSNLEVSGLGNAGEKVTVQTLVGNKVDSTPNNNVLDVQESSEPDSMFMFTGLDLNSKKFNLGSDEYQLHILTRTSLSEASWSIPEESKLLISIDRIAFADAAKSVSDILTYETSKGVNIIGINDIEPFVNGGTIGAYQQFKSANIGTITTETISASDSGTNVTIENIATNKIESTGTTSTIGTSEAPFSNGYINTIYCTTDADIKKIASVESIKGPEAGTSALKVENVNSIVPKSINSNGVITPSMLGNNSNINNHWSSGYIDNIYANKIDASTIENVTEIKSPESENATLRITGVTQIIPKATGSVSSGLGINNNRFSQGYFNNLTTQNLTVDSEFQRLRSNTKLDPGTYELYLTRDMSSRTDYYSFSLLEIIDKTNNGWIAYAHANVAIPIPIAPAVFKTCFYSFQLKCAPSSNTLEVFKLVNEDSGMNISLDDDTGVKIPGAESMAPITYKVFYRKIF